MKKLLKKPLIYSLVTVMLFTVFLVGCNMNDSFIKTDRWGPYSGVMNNVIIINCDVKNAVVECTAETGNLYCANYNKPEKTVMATPNMEIAWIADSPNDDYIEIIIWNNAKIMAYGLIKVHAKNENTWEKPEILISKRIKKDISKEEVKRQFEELKKSP